MVLKGFSSSLEYARKLDTEDPLRAFRDEFYLPEGMVYMDGNSLGLCPIEGENSLMRVIDEWKHKGIEGWLSGEKPWFYFAEELGRIMAPLVGARPGEVICTGTTTVNQHALLNTFYKPSGGKTKIMADEMNFPSDIYAIKGHLKMRGYDPGEHLVLVPAEEDGSLSEERIIEHLANDVVLAILPSVLFRTGQLLDIARIVAAAHHKDIIVGFDCSHSAGVVPHSFSSIGVDFAFWCGYKYLNGGPGCPAFLYLNQKHFDLEPLMAGWFGYQKHKQFDMSLDFLHQRNAGGWQISTPSLFGMAPLEGSLAIINRAGIGNIRKKSLGLTSCLISLAKELLQEEPYGFRIGTPEEPERRGGHVALVRGKEVWRICEAMKDRKIIPDFRPPAIIRLAPSPLYSRFEDVWYVIHAIREIIDNREYKKFSRERNPVS